MPSLKEVRNRITSINSTQQITRAMKMVAAAKLRRAQDAVTGLKPYSNKLRSILDNLQKAGSMDSPFTENRPVNKVLVIAVTSDRGLCGAFNANIMKSTIALIQEQYPMQHSQGNVEILTIGKKGYEALTRRDYPVNDRYLGLFGNLTFEKAREAAEYALEGFKEERYDEVIIVYNHFKNVITQIVQNERLLPLVADVAADETGTINSEVDYIFEPSVEHITETIVPQALKLQLYSALLDSNAAEQGARMSAMDKATENAGELLKDLKLVYNRTRQAIITREITEIVGGAGAL